MSRKVSKETISLIALLTAFVLGGLIVSNPDQNSIRTVGVELSADPSIYNDRESGSKALFEWTKKLGYDGEVERVDWSHLPESSTLLISVAPESVQGFDILGAATGDNDDGKLSVADARGVERWLQSGRTLLLLTSRLPANMMFVGGSGGSSGDAKPTFGDTVGLAVDNTQNGSQQTFVPMQPSPLTAGVDSIKLSSGASRVARRKRDSVTLFGNVQPMPGNLAHAEPAVTMFAVGKGRIIAIADDYFASNRNLSEADNSAFLANIISTSARPGSEVLFDEFHHGDLSSSSPTVWSAMGKPLQAASWQAALVFLLIVAMTAPRFGAVKVYKRGEVRASGEYLTSLSGIYHRAEAAVPALEIIYRQFLRDICERLALPPDVPLDKLANIIARQTKIAPDGIKRLLAACELGLDRKQLTSRELLHLTRQMEQIKRQLN